MTGRAGVLAVALHDVEPRWAQRCREVREWLAERGVARLTLLAVPAPRHHPISAAAPGLVAWMRERAVLGDAIAQHGLTHEGGHDAPWPRRVLAGWQGAAAAEFPGLSREAAGARVRAGREILLRAGLASHGFVAPAYAYTRALRAALADEGVWFADLLGLSCPQGRLHSAALTLGTSTAARRRLSPVLLRARCGLSGRVLRLDVHPADFDHPGHVAALAAVLRSQRRRSALTYDDIAG